MSINYQIDSVQIKQQFTIRNKNRLYYIRHIRVVVNLDNVVNRYLLHLSINSLIDNIIKIIVLTSFLIYICNMLVKLYEDSPNQREIDKVIEVLRSGGIVIYPTDTLYAFGCDAMNVRAVEKICALKGINPDRNNLSIICYDLSDISEYARINTATFKLMRRNLPGPFTFILNTTSTLPRIYKKKKTVGIRVPDNNIIRELVNQLGSPIMTTSVKGDEDEDIGYRTNPELIYEKWGNVADIVVDGGDGGIEPSTVVDCTGDLPVIIRQGKGELIY